MTFRVIIENGHEIYEPGCVATIKQPLRRTLVHFAIIRQCALA